MAAPSTSPSPQPTPEQAAILEAREVDIVVSAGAGSGKTHVLVERYIGLLDGCEVPQIAAVTFTEAAATEMRDRVRRAVMGRPALERHRAALDEAVIGTIHSLCLRLLREHPVEAGIDPAAAVLPEDEAELLRHLACNAAIDDAAEHGDERTAALSALSVWSVSTMLPAMVHSRDDVRHAFAALGPREEWETHIRTRLDVAFAQGAGDRAAIAREAFAEVRALRPAITGKLREVVDRVVAAMDGPGSARANATAAAKAVNLQSGSRSDPNDIAVKAAMRTFRDVTQELDKLPQWNEWDAPALEALDGLRALFEDACDRYAALKAERHALDFLDLEIEAVRLLADHPSVAAETRARFRHLMVDEAQDVSPVQAELVRLILRGDGSGEDLRPWLFLVGDVKQSIYRFRGADVKQFNSLRGEVEGRGGRVLPLSRSFRTHDDLVERFNELFEVVFADPDAGHAAPMERLGGRGASPEQPHVVVLPIADLDVEGEKAPQFERRRLEAALLADEVARLLDEGRQVWNKRTQAYEPAQPKHIAVLLRRFANVHIFEQALEARGIPYATPSGTGFFGRQEVLDLTNLLRWIAEPEDQIALVGLLRSPMFMIADDTLLALADSAPTIWLALHHPPDALPTEDRLRCEYAARTLRALQAFARSATADAVIERALHATAYEAAWAGIDGGEQVLANVRKLARLVRGLAGYSIADVVDYLERRRDDLAAREGPAVLDRPDAVQMMTVHGAKGLEFPIVFVPEAQVDPFTTWDAVRWRAADGISVTLAADEGDTRRPRPGFYELLQQQDQREDAAEHDRLFYVAATRAADRVYLSGDAGDRGWLADVMLAIDSGALRDVEVRGPAVVGRDDPGGRRPRPPVQPPAVDLEQDYVSALVDRPAVIPLRSSTPVTALKAPTPYDGASAATAGDGLGTLRGNVAHRAIEATFLTGKRPDLVGVARAEADRPLDDETLAGVAQDVAVILDRFEASALFEELRKPEADARFELPFAWDWDGIPVHGSIDLVYRDADGGWRVVDFKTDRVSPSSQQELVRRYTVQIGLYGRALEAATGARPSLGLLFLRTGELVDVPWDAVDAEFAAARQRVNAGALLAPDEADERADLDGVEV